MTIRLALPGDLPAIAPAWHGMGYGGKLMAFAEQTALALGVSVIKLYTHGMMTENIALYKRLGYEKAYRANHHGLGRVYIQKRLVRS